MLGKKASCLRAGVLWSNHKHGDVSSSRDSSVVLLTHLLSVWETPQRDHFLVVEGIPHPGRPGHIGQLFPG